MASPPESPSLRGKTILITGATRGIGKAIALRIARDGANIALASKTTTENPKLEGTIYSVAEEIERAGGRALALECDLRNGEQIEAAVKATVEKFDGLDVVVCNAGVLGNKDMLSLPTKTFDLLNAINTRGTYILCKAALPHLLKSNKAHVLMISPSLDLDVRHFSGRIGYYISKYNMSLIAFGMAEEYNGRVACNTLWPRSAVLSAAITARPDAQEVAKRSRWPSVMADAAYAIVTQPVTFTSKFLIDEAVLRALGKGDEEMVEYAVDKEMAKNGEVYMLKPGYWRGNVDVGCGLAKL